jgi:hypothetical protein
MAGSYAWVINYGTGKNVYTPSSTIHMHQHYPFSSIEFVDAFTDEFETARFSRDRDHWREFSTRVQHCSVERRVIGEARKVPPLIIGSGIQSK